jgi:chromatin segregation and condensation protein Rec8/ScpA/Scc1 (kleisin family)
MTAEEKANLAAIRKRDAEQGSDSEPVPYWLTKAPSYEAYKEAMQKHEEKEPKYHDWDNDPIFA